MTLFLTLYLLVGIILLTLTRGYLYIPPPSRFVEIKEKPGTYIIKEYIPMPTWIWWILLTVLWLPIIILVIWQVSKEFKL